jgi:phosphopantetheinyl transferase (holo-ACP synthase)
MKIPYKVHISETLDAFTNSREALRYLLGNAGHSVRDLKEDLELLNYQELKKYPNYLTSLSHTKGAGAALLVNKSDYLSAGIDIEWGEREMKSGTEKFFRHPQDSDYPNNLELWTMKEAAFKALSPLGFPGVLVLSKIIIQHDIFWTEERKDFQGQIQSERLVVGQRELVLSLAFLTRSN